MPSKKKKARPSIPDVSTACEAFGHFVQTIARLREPKKGCPWDLEQTHESLRPYMIEEAYEAAEVMSHLSKKGSRALCEELGDVLLQVVLHAQVALDQGDFSIVDVINSIDRKIIHRHPHVFSPKDALRDISSACEVKDQWDELKKQEKKKQDKVEAGIFDKAKTKVTPASIQALQIGKIAHAIKFDWSEPTEVFCQLLSEIDELMVEFSRKDRLDRKKVSKEIGDVYFTLAQLCRHLKLDPEIVALDGNRKFLRRFSNLEKIARKRKIDLTQAPMPVMEKLWAAAKKIET